MTNRISRERAWTELILAAIGEQFSTAVEEGDAVNGVTVSIRRENAILQVWNKQAHPEAETKKILNFTKNKVLQGINIVQEFYKRTFSILYAYQLHTSTNYTSQQHVKTTNHTAKSLRTNSKVQTQSWQRRLQRRQRRQRKQNE